MTNVIVQDSSSVTTIKKTPNSIEIPLITPSTVSNPQSTVLVNNQQLTSFPTIQLPIVSNTIETRKHSITIQTGRPQVTMNVSGDVLSGSGDTNPYAFIPAGEDIPAFRVCHVVNGMAYLSSASMNPQLSLAIKGMSVSHATAGSTVQIQLGAIVQNPGWSLSTGTPVFLGENGGITQQIPTDGLSVEIGTALSASRLFLDVEEPISL